MRVLHVVPTYLPATRYGGPIRSVHGLCKALAGIGHEVHVLTTNVDGDDVSSVDTVLPVNREGVLVRYFPSPLPRLYWSPAMARFLTRKISSYDLLHLHSVFLWPTSAAAGAARSAGVPYVLSPRGMLERDLIRQRSTLAKKAWISLFEKRNLRNAAAVHVTSNRERHEIEALGLRPLSFATIANGVDADKLELSPVARRESRQILYLGRLSWKKGIDRLIDALAHMPEAELVIAGPDERGYAAGLEAQARTLGVRERVTFTGGVSGEEKWRLLDEATLLVLPSRSENFGIVVIEALARGLPVVMTPEVGIAEEIVQGGGGVIADAAPESLAQTIHALIESPERRGRMGEMGHRLVRERFAWPRVAGQMEKLYRDIVASKVAA